MRRWERNAEFWIRIIRERLDPFRTEITDAAVLRALAPRAGETILDAGCGEGYLTRHLAGRGAVAVGVDRSSRLVDAAVATGRPRNGSAHFLLGDLGALPLTGSSFDAVLCNHSLNELRSLEPVFAELARLLKPGGSLVVLMLHPCFYGGRDAAGRRVEEYYTADQPTAALIKGVTGVLEHGLFRPAHLADVVRHHHRDKERDDGHHHHQLDQCETASFFHYHSL